MSCSECTVRARMLIAEHRNKSLEKRQEVLRHHCFAIRAAIQALDKMLEEYEKLDTFVEEDD